MVSAAAAQTLFEHLHGESFVAAVSADLGHQYYIAALAGEGFAQSFLAEAVVILPSVVEEVDARASIAMWTMRVAVASSEVGAGDESRPRLMPRLGGQFCPKAVLGYRSFGPMRRPPRRRRLSWLGEILFGWS